MKIRLYTQNNSRIGFSSVCIPDFWFPKTALISNRLGK